MKAETKPLKPSRIVTSMHIYSTNNIKSGKINPEPTVAKEVEARRKKSQVHTGELFVEGQGLQRVGSAGRMHTRQELRLSPSVSQIPNESRINQTESEKKDREKGVSAASLLFEEEKFQRGIKSPKNVVFNQVRQPSNIAVSSPKVSPRWNTSHVDNKSQILPKPTGSSNHPQGCGICKKEKCECCLSGGSYRGCAHCNREALNVSRNREKVPDVEAVKYLQDRILAMLSNDFKDY